MSSRASHNVNVDAGPDMLGKTLENISPLFFIKKNVASSRLLAAAR